MNEHPRGTPLGPPFLEPDGGPPHEPRRAGIEAIERELFNETTDVVEIALYINGRLIHTKTNRETVARVMALLTGTD
jgi:hypothetical protein